MIMKDWMLNLKVQISVMMYILCQFVLVLMRGVKPVLESDYKPE